LSERGNQGNG